MTSKFCNNNWLLPLLDNLLSEFLHTCNWLSRPASLVLPHTQALMICMYTSLMYVAQCLCLRGLHYLFASVELGSSVQPSKDLQTLTARETCSTWYHLTCTLHRFASSYRQYVSIASSPGHSHVFNVH